jgi:hypothetical protein
MHANVHTLPAYLGELSILIKRPVRKCDKRIKRSKNPRILTEKYHAGRKHQGNVFDRGDYGNKKADSQGGYGVELLNTGGSFRLLRVFCFFPKILRFLKDSKVFNGEYSVNKCCDRIRIIRLH